MRKNLTINCDMGEWDAPHLVNRDEEIMPYIDMCNIACGGHAGSSQIIKSTIGLARKENVKIGAHPGYEDRKNFGRAYIPLKSQELADALEKQLTIFLSVCKAQKIQPYHIKAHGALYHACNHLELEADVFISVIKDICPNLVVLVAPGSLLGSMTKREGLKTMVESFIDRRYNDDLSLVSRSEPNAVILDAKSGRAQFDLLSNGKICTNTGITKVLMSETTCIHGDNPKCMKILKAIRNEA